MMWPNVFFAQQWLAPGIAMLVVGFALALVNYWTDRLSIATRGMLILLRLLGLALLIVCLLEPMLRRSIPSTDVNSIVLMVDASESLTVRSSSSKKDTRIDRLRTALDASRRWQKTLDEDFDVRRYVFDSQVSAVNDFEILNADGRASNIAAAIDFANKRFQNKSCAGILVLSDGCATDDLLGAMNSKVPVYPVLVGSDFKNDIAIEDVNVSQTLFESAPATIGVALKCVGYAGEDIVVRLVNRLGKEVARETVFGVEDNKRFAVRFETKPQETGANYFTIQTFAANDEAKVASGTVTTEATFENNQQTVVVDRGRGPYRILYVGGRPNWEYKFLNRALYEDEEIELISMLRVAKREAKFSFRSNRSDRTNPLFRGFGGDEEDTEQYSEPVFVTLPNSDSLAAKLKGGFPKSADDLFEFDGIILDDVEAEFFTPDQMSLVEEFVSRRGGGLVMLGGQESFRNGQYARTPIGDMLPVYLDAVSRLKNTSDVRMELSREGMLQPWIRLRKTQPEEDVRLANMPTFKTISPVSSIKPGGSVLAISSDDADGTLPLIVEQRFGSGKTCAIMVGDLWRWQMQNKDDGDLSVAWRQFARWLVSDVPRRVELNIDQDNRVSLAARVVVRDEQYRALDNCRVVASIQPLDQTSESQSPIEILAKPDEEKLGEYHFEFFPLDAGSYQVMVTVADEIGETIGNTESGWVSQPAVAEFNRLQPDRDQLQKIAESSGGRLLELSELDAFCRSVPINDTMIVETKIEPWWHQWPVFVGALGCLICEWGIRRWKGLP